MIVKEFTGELSFLHPAYPCPINFDGITYPSVLHASCASMVRDPRTRELISMEADPSVLVKQVENNIPFIWDRLIDFQIQKYKNEELNMKLINFVDKGSIIEYTCSGNNVFDALLGRVNNRGLNMVGVITQSILEHGTDRESIVTDLFNKGVGLE